MNSIRNIIAVAVVFAAAVAALILWGAGSEKPEESANTLLPHITAVPPSPAGAPSLSPPENNEVPATPEPEPKLASVNLAFAGDIVMHPGLSTDALKDGKYDYSFLFKDISGYLRRADSSAATLKGTFPGETTYTGYPLIKAPDAMAKGIKEAGVDILSTAAKNSFDSRLHGVRRTLEVLEDAGILTVGTSKNQEELNAKRGMRIIDVNGIYIAYIAYTCVTGEIDYSAEPFSVNLVFDAATGTYDYDRMEKDIDFAREAGADLTVVFIQWGNEYYTSAAKYQVELSDFLFVRGADIIIGGHPFVPQPMEMRRITDKYGTGKTGFICYSLGNMASCYTDEFTNLTAILNINAEKNFDTGETYITDVAYVPLFMSDLNAYNITGADGRYKLWDIHAAIDDYESEKDPGIISERLYEAMVKGLSDIHGIFGEEYDFAVKNTVEELK